MTEAQVLAWGLVALAGAVLWLTWLVHHQAQAIKLLAQAGEELAKRDRLRHEELGRVHAHLKDVNLALLRLDGRIRRLEMY